MARKIDSGSASSRGLGWNSCDVCNVDNVPQADVADEVLTDAQLGSQLSPELSHQWDTWRHSVLDTIQTDFHGVLDRVSWDDLDWDAWRPLFEQGASARDAVHSAFGKVA